MSNIDIRSSNLENLIIGKLDAKWSARGDRILRYYIDLRHTKMNLHREVSAPELFILQSKVDALVAGWDDRFLNFQMQQALLSGKGAAEDMTADAIRRQEQIGQILAHTLGIDDAVDWEALKDRSVYPMPTRFPTSRPTTEPLPEPSYEKPAIRFVDILLGRKRQLLEQAGDRHVLALAAWEVAETERKTNHAFWVAFWETNEREFWAEHHDSKARFETTQAASHRKVDALRGALGGGDPEAVVEHASMVLDNSNYGGLIEPSYTVQYRPSDRLLMLEYALPAPDALPQAKSVKFVKATGKLVETLISDREKKANFESACYQICLRSIHELFEADLDKNLDAVLFNGVVQFVDPATGLELRSCILSLLAKRNEFCRIDLARADPKACFKAMKGVSASSLAALVPVPPVMEMDRDDRRFIESREVGADIGAGTNLAAISWDDFEHLVRELFEKEFLSRGGEVKVTQSSRDGGVDAIAFDPDPISGGKIVIQAKRYTRTVGVAAVRDLYGTVMNEGASKGILVTTSDYGPDAYRFASGKPLSLLNGANLLHLLQRHGYQAKIDIEGAREARS